jgi:hypothetical protein
MNSFIEWLIVRETLEFNELLHEAQKNINSQIAPIPAFIVAKRMDAGLTNWQKFPMSKMYEVAREQYLKELKETWEKYQRGIENHDLVFTNAIRHQLTNYDRVWRAIEAHHNNGNIDICKKLELDIELFKQVKQTSNTILANMPVQFRLPHADGPPTQAANIKALMDSKMNKKISRDEARLIELRCDQRTATPVVPTALTAPEETTRPNLQKSDVEIAIDTAMKGGIGTLVITGTKKSMESKLDKIRRKASENRLKVRYDQSNNRIEISA